MDGDEYTPFECGGWDCDDYDSGRYPGAVEFCDGIDSDCDGSLEPDEQDLDGDSSICFADCDDSDPHVHQGAPELCDGIDNDCDGDVDEGVDDDGDGDGISACAGDCDDLDRTTYPGAAERCDGRDNDCDGSPGAGEVDGDGDGHMVCGGDCDDEDSSTSPSAADWCDGLDNDCDGSIDGGCVDCDVWVEPGHGGVQGAIDAAMADTVICLHPGDHHAGFTVPSGTPSLHLIGVAGPNQTRVDAYHQGRVARLEEAGADITLEGLALIGGVATEGAGLLIEGGQPNLWNLSVRDNIASNVDAPAMGGGIRMVDASPHLVEVTVADNAATAYDTIVYGPDGHGAGMYIENSNPRMERLTVVDNWADASGGGMTIVDSDVLLDRGRIESNQVLIGSESSGGGLLATESNCELHNVVIDGNSLTATVAEGGGAAFRDSSVWLQNAVISRNAVFPVDAHYNGSARGGGLDIEGGDVWIVNANLVANVVFDDSGHGGAGIYAGSGSVQIAASALVGNQSGARGGGVDGSGAILSVVNSLFLLNEAGEGGGGALFFGVGDLLLRHVDLWMNDPEDVAGPGEPLYQEALSLAPHLLDTAPEDVIHWDLHLDTTSPLVDLGDPLVLDPDGTPGDIGPFGGAYAGEWDLDWDGFPAWWLPGSYDPATSPGFDCDDRDPTVYPGQGC